MIMRRDGPSDARFGRRIAVGGVGGCQAADHRWVPVQAPPQFVGRQAAPFTREVYEQGASRNQRPLSSWSEYLSRADVVGIRDSSEKRSKCDPRWASDHVAR